MRNIFLLVVFSFSASVLCSCKSNPENIADADEEFLPVPAVSDSDTLPVNSSPKYETVTPDADSLFHFPPSTTDRLLLNFWKDI